MPMLNRILLLCLTLLLLSASFSYAQYGYEGPYEQQSKSSSIKERLKEKPYVLIIAVLFPIAAVMMGVGFITAFVLSLAYLLFNIFLSNTGYIGEILFGAAALYFLIMQETR